MRSIKLVTGTTDNYGLRTLNDLLALHFRTVDALQALGLLRTSALVPEFYQVQLDSGCTLTVVHRDPTTQDWQFCLTLVGDTDARMTRLPLSFLRPEVGVNLKNVQVHEPGVIATPVICS